MDGWKPFSVRDSIGEIAPYLILVLAFVALILVSERRDEENLLNLVEYPNRFEPCVPVELADPPQPYIDLLTASAESTALKVSTARHWGLGFCIVLYCDKGQCTAMINPEGSVAGAPNTLVARDPVICREPTIVEHYPILKMGWQDKTGATREQTFRDEDAYRLQLALDVLMGKDICMRK